MRIYEAQKAVDRAHKAYTSAAPGLARKAAWGQYQAAISIAEGAKRSADFKRHISAHQAALVAAKPKQAAAPVPSPREASTSFDFAHLVPAPGRSAEAPIAAAAVPFAERMMSAVATVQGVEFDASKMASGPVQRTRTATGADIMAAVRAAHPSRFEGEA
jgi:hypothetical protein